MAIKIIHLYLENKNCDSNINDINQTFVRLFFPWINLNFTSKLELNNPLNHFNIIGNKTIFSQTL